MKRGGRWAAVEKKSCQGGNGHSKPNARGRGPRLAASQGGCLEHAAASHAKLLNGQPGTMVVMLRVVVVVSGGEWWRAVVVMFAIIIKLDGDHGS